MSSHSKPQPGQVAMNCVVFKLEDFISLDFATIRAIHAFDFDLYLVVEQESQNKKGHEALFY